MRRLLSVLLAILVIAVPLTISGTAADTQMPFDDVQSTAWYYGAIKTAYENGLFHGTSDTTFSPDHTMTRAMFTKVLANISMDADENPTEQHFSDVPKTAWYYKPIEWATKYGIVLGTGDFKFSPEDEITREQMATMLYRYARATGNADDSAVNQPLDQYADANQISDYADQAVMWAVKNKIIIGRSATELAPKASATRAETAQMFVNAMSILTKKEILSPESPLPTPTKAEIVLNNMTLEEKVGQLFLARYPGDGKQKEITTTYHPAGYTFYANDFQNKTPAQVQAMTSGVQEASSTPMFTAVDEEGGTVVRVSSNKLLANTPFESLQSVYNRGGLDAITQDTNQKDKMLLNLGLNLNLAPVCDVSTDPNDYMYKRTVGQSAEITSEVIDCIVGTMNDDNISCALKHFPGYGNNVDTHTGIAVDNRPMETFQSSDFLPFQAGINAGASSILVSHNIVNCMDKNVPASLSKPVHDILRNDLGFTGVIMTDDLAMGAITQFTKNQSPAVMALQAGNDMIITSDIATDYQAIMNALKAGTISVDDIDTAVKRILVWKINKGLI